ncbi:hypothetical protein CERSUDRAFT_118321 [Gelatoporia subvermispora B]|uniref:Uncharacterized protein n=1 Tax=Ceriporiopsis subvermispora (strain B) TaxID=914234 RepID=M2Q7Q4_CERS8|nr:hypothetical protein CERSUDRAFT_118321 [Gelatoporia subvermispora B]
MPILTRAQGPTTRSSTGPVLLPAFAAHETRTFMVPLVPTKTFLTWTFGRATVFWRIWPAVVLHTTFAAVVVSLSLRTDLHLSTPNVMLTLLGVVIGFVIAYRAGSGYDRYWQGRAGWSDVIRTSRTLSRLVWIHVPPRVTPWTTDAKDPPSHEEARAVMAEKRVALDLVQGYVVALKHHLRGEMGIYYEDLYHLVKPLHGHAHPRRGKRHEHDENEIAGETQDRDHQDNSGDAESAERIQQAEPGIHIVTFAPAPQPAPSPKLRNPIVPPINAYGSISHMPPSAGNSPSPAPVSSQPPSTASMRLGLAPYRPPIPHPAARSASTSSTDSFASTDSGERAPLIPRLERGEHGLFARVSGELVPFGSLWGALGCMVGMQKRRRDTGEDVERGADGEEDVIAAGAGAQGGVQRGWSAQAPHTTRLHDASERLGFTHAKHRPRVAGGGENLPLEVLRSLSVWLGVLEARGSVPGNALGGMFGCLASFEDSLSSLERILTTPLPFVYSVHIKHTVWIYLFFLPFQLVDLFRWYTIPGVCIASFIYLGFLAAGEEIEQPFGYDENDLDLDLFCEEIVHRDIERLKRMPCPNVIFNGHHGKGHTNGNGNIEDAEGSAKAKKVSERVEDVFGHYM